MWLTDRIALVGSGRIGYALSSPWDCNVFLIRGDERSVLIDAGSGLADAMILRSIAEHTAGRGIDGIFLTHSHVDHVGGAPGLASALQAPIFAPADARAALARADTVASAFQLARDAGLYPHELEYPVVTVAADVEDGGCWELGGVWLESKTTRGHSYDHTVYLLHGAGEGAVLFSGDLLLADGRVILQAIEDCRIDLYAQAVLRLASGAVSGIAPGHGPVDLEAGRAPLDSAAASFSLLVPPESLR